MELFSKYLIESNTKELPINEIEKKNVFPCLKIFSISFIFEALESFGYLVERRRDCIICVDMRVF